MQTRSLTVTAAAVHEAPVYSPVTNKLYFSQLRGTTSPPGFLPRFVVNLKKRYFLGWWLDKGRADILMLGFPPNVKWSLGGIPLSFVRRIVHWTARWIIALEPSERFASRLKVQWLLGMVIECRRSSKSVLPTKFE